MPLVLLRPRLRGRLLTSVHCHALSILWGEERENVKRCYVIDRDVPLRQTAVLCVALALTGLASNVGGMRNTSIRRASAAV